MELMTILFRTCSCCSEDKPLSEYYRGQYHCKECRKQKSKDYYWKNKISVGLRVEKWKLNNPEKVKGYAEKIKLRKQQALNPTRLLNDIIN